ncbi:MAG: MBL fold metallo-hydrolase [Planctomycetota bacterium]|nr:MBL fold metallo-hydrolase [Planctomycetota bacterium]
MIAASLQSGSNGNCIYVEADGVKLLLDAGISGYQAERRLAMRGRDIRDVDALIISHDHRDHVRCAGVYQRKYGIPIYVTAQTLQAAMGRNGLGTLRDVRCFTAGELLRFGKVAIETIPTPHDSADGVAFVVAAGGRRLGILTDLGCVFDELRAAVGSLDAVFLESNYDPHMLETGVYPRFLKDRISGPGGHISNVEAAELLSSSAGGRLKWACLAHLSEQNNDPQLALATHRKILGRRLPLYAASRYEPTDIFEL